MAGAQVAWGALGGIVGFKNFANRVTDAEIGVVHVASDHKDATDSQMVVGDISEPQGFTLGVKTTEEGEDRCASSFGTTEDLVHAIWIFGINTPIAGEEGSKTGWVGKRGEEVVPTNVLTTGFWNGHVNQVTGPGD